MGGAQSDHPNSMPPRAIHKTAVASSCPRYFTSRTGAATQLRPRQGRAARARMRARGRAAACTRAQERRSPWPNLTPPKPPPPPPAPTTYAFARGAPPR